MERQENVTFGVRQHQTEYFDRMRANVMLCNGTMENGHSMHTTKCLTSRATSLPETNSEPFPLNAGSPELNEFGLRRRNSVPTDDVDSDYGVPSTAESCSPRDDDSDMCCAVPTAGRTAWNVKSSYMAKNTLNPIRQIVDGLKLTPNPEKPMIALSIGDPTTYGNFSPPVEAVEAVVKAAREQKFDGYAPSTGILSAREAVAKYTARPESPLTAKDVILTSGASHALELCISVLCDRGSNLLLPCPGFSIYKTIACSLGVKCRSYRLLPEADWEIDLHHLASLIDADTAAIVVNNPSNPCGSVYSKEHLQDILEVAHYYRVPVIADEIYDDLVFPGHVFYPLASLTDSVPVLACGGLTKKFICPGWRMGWITIHDRHDIFETEVRSGLTSLSQRILGPNALVQGAVPSILENVPQTYFQSIINTLETNAIIAFDGMNAIPGLSPIMPAGAMYMMTKINIENFPNFTDELAFTSQLVSEESVFCLPGQCFDFPYYFRIVLTVPEDKMKEAVSRIASFCERYYVESGRTSPADDNLGLQPSQR
ncbi:tyrosine aminotransferase-like [Paramacrobiotus metropolitanus]|uniref:tyrosine aminotransferase-like n=1 Tax=Paramacrobiotus metropolitanus TaxID=2943436 RepID=UPI0024459FE5|nr:tyrosine aminotransferase-like [Paramacrobiotus metropolitanus]XP_055327187.1 tyrosine aminotransferase-like [Paramacrobiotus metropolitanus]XP_055327188.1 tyrosine aminotransferase-like [Paramacrobiotus metropolitanus]